MEMKRQVLFSVAVLLLSSSSFASGFALFEHSARGMGRAGAMVGQADDASAVYFNPAGITQLEGLHWDIGVTPILPLVNVSDTYGNVYDVDDSLTNVPHAYLTYQFNDKFWLGAGFFAPFGLATKFDENWAGRYSNHNAEVTGLNFNLNMAYKVNEKLSLAIGVDAQFFDVTLEQKILPSAVVYSNQDAIVSGIMQSQGLDPYTAGLVYNTQFLEPSTHLADIDQSISGNQTKMGYNLAAHYKASEKISLGFSYRSSIEYDIKGKATYKDVTSGFIFPFESVFFNADGVAVLELPSFMYFGFAYQANEKTVLEVDAWQTGWSSYDTLDLTLNNGVGHVVSQKKWDDVWAYRFGAEHQFNERYSGTLGYVYDFSPIPDEFIDYTLPSNDRQVFSVGCSAQMGKFRLDASYGYLTVKGRHIAARPQDFIFESDIDGTVHLYNVGISYKR